jgi:hypothetical protein
MLNVKSKPVLLELYLDILSCRTVFAVYRCLYYHSGRGLICGFGDFHVNVAIAWVHAGIFKKRVCYVDQLKFTTTARLINRKRDRVLRPSQNSCYVNFLRAATGQRDMLSSVAVIHGVWLEGYAAADVSGDTLGDISKAPAGQIEQDEEKYALENEPVSGHTEPSAYRLC